jgi:cbb3-type cytochrome oxidase subunit 1
MTWFVKAFLKASLAWLALGVTLGVAMAAHPVWTVYRLAHIHMLLLGFVTMMIYGVAYHVIPRFSGFPLHRPAAAGWHWWLANTGLVLMTIGLVTRVHLPSAGTVVLAVGGTLSAVGAYTFAYLIWLTLDGKSEMRAAAARAARAVERSMTGGDRSLTVVAVRSGARRA